MGTCGKEICKRYPVEYGAIRLKRNRSEYARVPDSTRGDGRDKIVKSKFLTGLHDRRS